MKQVSTQGKTLILEAQKKDGSQNASIKLPLGLIGFANKLASLVPSSVKESINKELRAKGVQDSFEDLVSEGQEALMTTLHDIHIDVKDKNQTVKLYVD